MTKLTKILILIGVAFYIIYDVIVCIGTAAGLSGWSWDATLSQQIARAAVFFPFITTAFFALGMHFFFYKVGKKLFGRLGSTRFAIWIPIASIWLILNIINLFVKWSWMSYVGDSQWIPATLGIPLGLLWFQNIKIKKG